MFDRSPDALTDPADRHRLESENTVTDLHIIRTTLGDNELQDTRLRVDQVEPTLHDDLDQIHRLRAILGELRERVRIDRRHESDHRFVEGGIEDLLLVGEVLVDSTGTDAGTPGYRRDTRRVVPVLAQNVEGGRRDALTRGP